MRLLSIYDKSNSFRNYASNLLWLTLFLASQRSDVPTPLMESAIKATSRWSDDSLGYCLAIFDQRLHPIPGSIAYLVGQHDPRSSSSVIVRRHGERFRELFDKKFAARYPDGMTLKSSKRPRRIHYHPASATLLHDDSFVRSLPLMPDVLKISSQFKPIIDIWEERIDDLKAYNRAHRASGGEMTADAYESLPKELREDDHPQLDTWMAVWEQYANEDGWPLVPVSAIAELKGIAERPRLTKSQCNRILATADALEIGVEPDPRITGKNYLWEEHVSFFFLESSDAEDMTDYNAAAVLLRLGLSIAEADGTIDKDELDHITHHLEGQFNLSKNQSKRLEQLEYLLLNCDEADATIGKFLSKRLNHDQRLLIGEFLVGIAAVDEVVTAKEVQALRKAYRSLDLAASEVDKLLDRHAVSEAVAGEQVAAEQEFHLDMHAVSRIMTETREVASILKQAMSEDGEDDTEGPVVTATATAVAEMPKTADVRTAVSAEGLAPRFQPFMQAVVAKDEWDTSELTALAKEHGVMLSGAVEAINEWSTEELGDWLIEEGDKYAIRRGLLGDNG